MTDILDFLRGLNVWWDGLSDKANFWLWVIFLFALPTLFVATGLYGLFVILSLVVIGVRAWYIYFDKKTT